MDRRLFVLALGMFALGTDSFVIAGVLPELAAHFHVGPGAAGQMTTAYALSYAIFAPVVAAMAAHVPRRTLLLSSLVIFVVANLLTAVAPTFAIALLTRVAAGFGAAMFAPTASGTAAMLVPPERRGIALSIIFAGLTAATALGAPMGTVIGGLGDWRWTMVFVAGLATASAVGTWALLSEIPLPPQVSLRQRIAPLHDSRVALTLLTTLLGHTGNFLIYTYFAVVFAKVIHGNAALFGALLVLWGSAGTVSNLVSGRLVHHWGERRLLLTVFTVLIGIQLATYWSAQSFWTGVIGIAAFGLFSWGFNMPQQFRLVELAPNATPVVLGLNTSATYFGVSSAGVIGGIVVASLGANSLGVIAAGFAALALVVSELATRRITRAAAFVSPVTASASAVTAANDTGAPQVTKAA